MNIEIERKFLVDREKWRVFAKPSGVLIRQGYIFSTGQKSLRVRIIGSRGFLAVKVNADGLRRDEFEYEIPGQDALDLFENLSEGIVSKVRYSLSFNDHLWEVDEFLDENRGLLMAEVELQTENEMVELPGWLLKEVSGDTRYFNSELAVNPYTRWQKG